MIDGAQAPKGGWKMITHSSHVTVVYFKDGNSRTFYSWDWKRRYGRYDIEEGHRRIKAKCAEYGTAMDVAETYEHLGDKNWGKIVKQYYEGEEIPVPAEGIVRDRSVKGRSRAVP